MIVWVNKPMTGDEVGWKLSSGRSLVLVNNTGQAGQCIKNVNLGYVRKNRTHYIYLNKPRKRPSSKTVGVFVWPGPYTAYCGERFVGKTKGNGGIDGMFGIYNVGTLIEVEDGTWYELSKDEGWIKTREGVA